MSSIAVLGGSRFIGPHLINALHDSGRDVTIFNRNMTSPPISFPKDVKIVKGNRNNVKDIKLFFRNYFDVVIDLSGYVPEHVEPIVDYCSNNIGHYLFCSTSSVYKRSQINPITENTKKLIKSNTYGGLKSQIEDILINKNITDNWPVTIFRPQAVFGPFDPWAIGLIYYRIVNKQPIHLNKRISTKINPLYIYDLVKSFLLTIDNEISYGKIYGVAGDDIVSVNDLINICSKSIKIKPIINYINFDKNYEIKYNLGNYWLKYDHETNCNKIKIELGIDFTPLIDGINITFNWIQNNYVILKKYSFIGEQYVLNDKPIPFYMRIIYYLLKSIKSFIKIVKNIILNL